MERLEPDSLRQIFSHFPTGVTVITGDTAAGPAGMAVNSFTSVSLDPPMVLFCPAKSSLTWPTLRVAGRCCVNILADHQEALCRQFAQRGAGRFADVSFHRRDGGPALDEAIVWLDCEVAAEHDAGDHTIVVGRVVSMDENPDSMPLVFHRGRYRSVR